MNLLDSMKNNNVKNIIINGIIYPDLSNNINYVLENFSDKFCDDNSNVIIKIDIKSINQNGLE